VGAGGPIIAMQVENEYGSYGNDHLYLRHLELKFRQQQIDAILFSSNGYSSSSATLTSTETFAC